MSKIKTTEVTPEEYNDPEYEEVAKWFIMNALGNRMYFHTRSRKKAQEACDEIYGMFKYTIRTAKVDKTDKEYSAVGNNTRKCFSPRLKGLK